MPRAQNQLVKLLQEKKLTLALGESMTCGLASHQLSVVKGTSEVFKGSIVCYHEEVKTSLLKVSRKLIDKYSAESQQATDSIAINLKRIIKADIHAAITGLAANGGSETRNKPVGTVFFTVCFANRVHRQRKVFRGTPLQIHKKACNGLYEFILSILL